MCNERVRGLRRRRDNLAPAVILAALLGPIATPLAHAGGPHALYIIDANSGAVLVDQEGSGQRYPASLTKMMTLYLTFEALEARRLDMKTRIKISPQAASAAPSKLEIPAGDDIAVEDAIRALITKSANDVAIALAEHLGGTEANFARLMTEKAHALGMKNTTFRNASGLPDGGQTTTAKDMTTLGLRLYDDFPRQFPLFATRSFAFNGATHKNHNTLMLQLPGINGIKTGYTHASGFNLVTSYALDGKHVIGAIFGGETAGARNATMRIALTKALSRASTIKTRKPALVARAEARAVEAREAATRARTAAVAAAAAAAEAARKAKLAAAVAPQPPGSAARSELALSMVGSAAPAGTAPTDEGPPVPLAPAPPPRFEVARVRKNDVTASAPPAPAVAPAPAPAFAIASAARSPRISDVLKSHVVPRPPDAPVEVARQPSTFQQQMAALAQNITPPSPPAPVAAASGPTPPDSRRMGYPPADAPTPARIARTEPAFRLNGPPPTPAGPMIYEIQIGAYASPVEAEKRLNLVRAQAPALLDGHIPTRQTVTINDKILYRARFGGFDQTTAAATCLELTRIAINCIAIRAE